MNRSTTSGSAGLNVDDVVNAITAATDLVPWVRLRGKAVIRESNTYLPAGSDVLVLHTGWLANQPDGMQWVVLMEPATLTLLKRMAEALGVPATDEDLAAMLAWRAQVEFTEDQAARQRTGNGGL